MALKFNKIKNSRWLGFALGIIGPFLGSLLYYLWYANEIQYRGYQWPDLAEFIHRTIKLGLVVNVLSIGGLLNLAIFFIFLQLGWYRTSRAVLLATMVYIAPLLALKFLL